MRIIVLGGGMVGLHLLSSLKEEHHVVVVEKRQDRVEELREKFPQANILHGDACEPAVLDAAGTVGADVVAAVTGDDEDNLVISYLAKFEYGVPMVFARVNNPKNEWLFTSEMGVDVCISGAHIMASLMREEMTTLEMAVLLRLHRGDTALVENTIRPESKAAGRTVRDLGLPEDVILVAIAREDGLVIPRGSVELRAGDRVLALAKSGARERLARALS